jgi:hypothetical protein
VLCYPWIAFEKDKDYGTWAVSLGRRGCFNWGGYVMLTFVAHL